ncbi:MAG TPA: DUF3090 family protein [Acidimicrobiia bacterium]|jgi:uncharacterized repeat protein (TIGR03847 family)|nr:DUF3090 family protein [Acidimicrobiia bacterium]
MDENEIELETVDSLGAGAVGDPGEREFFLQARTESAQLTVLVEKEQVALLATEAVAFLDRIAEDYPEEGASVPEPVVRQAGLREPTVPLFRARLIGLGFDPERELVLIELRERSSDDEDDGEALKSEAEATGADLPDLPEAGTAVAEPTDEEEEGYVARIYATRLQVRAMAAKGAEAVAAGRPLCPLCDMPMDPSGHRCPRWN